MTLYDYATEMLEGTGYTVISNEEDGSIMITDGRKFAMGLPANALTDPMTVTTFFGGDQVHLGYDENYQNVDSITYDYSKTGILNYNDISLQKAVSSVMSNNPNTIAFIAESGSNCNAAENQARQIIYNEIIKKLNIEKGFQIDQGQSLGFYDALLFSDTNSSDVAAIYDSSPTPANSAAIVYDSQLGGVPFQVYKNMAARGEKMIYFTNRSIEKVQNQSNVKMGDISDERMVAPLAGAKQAGVDTFVVEWDFAHDENVYAAFDCDVTGYILGNTDELYYTNENGEKVKIEPPPKVYRYDHENEVYVEVSSRHIPNMGKYGQEYIENYDKYVSQHVTNEGKKWAKLNGIKAFTYPPDFAEDLRARALSLGLNPEKVVSDFSLALSQMNQIRSSISDCNISIFSTIAGGDNPVSAKIGELIAKYIAASGNLYDNLNKETEVIMNVAAKYDDLDRQRARMIN